MIYKFYLSLSLKKKSRNFFNPNLSTLESILESNSLKIKNLRTQTKTVHKDMINRDLFFFCTLCTPFLMRKLHRKNT